MTSQTRHKTGLARPLWWVFGPRPALVCLGALALHAIAQAADGTVDLSAFPAIAAADGRSTVLVTAEVRDSSGRLVPDGTRVLFESKLGRFQESIVETRSGYARSTLETGSIPGTDTLRVTVVGLSANATLEIDYVADASLLSSAKEFVEVVSNGTLFYGTDARALEASAPNQGVTLRYRDVTIEADELQLKVATYEVKARNARLKIGEKAYEFGELSFRLNMRRGIGMTSIDKETLRIRRVGEFGRVERVVQEQYSPVAVSPGGLQALDTPVGEAQFRFDPIAFSRSTVEAKKIVVYPAREIHFHSAHVRVGGDSVMRVPLFQLSTSSNSPIITDQFVNISGNQLAVNYPYYLSLKPGETSLLRLRYGNRYSTGVGAAGGAYLDYEIRWNRGDEMEGGLTFGGIGRSDWGLNLRQYLKLGPGTSIAAQLDMPANRTLFGNLNFNHDLNFARFNLTASAGRSLRGPEYRTQSYSAVIEGDPIRVDGVPAQLFLGLYGNQNQFDSQNIRTTTQRAGLRARLRSDLLRLDRNNSLFLAGSFSTQSGRNVSGTFAVDASAALSSRLGIVNLTTTYDFVDDGVFARFLGRHRVTAEGYADLGSVGLRAYVARSLDIARTNVTLGVDWRLDSNWRMDYRYYLDLYDGTSFLDHTFVIARRVGVGEIGISYSHRLRRFGLEVFSARFN